MQSIPYFFVALLLVTCLLATVAVWARNRLWIRAGAVVIVAVVLVIEFIAFTDLLSRPKPAALERASGSIDEARVIAASLHEGEAIYLWLRLPDMVEPRYYTMPWNQRTAIELRKAIQSAQVQGTHVIMRKPFGQTPESRAEPRFYAWPQPALPLKPRPEVYDYHHPSLSA